MYMKKWIMICACVAAFQTALAQRITRQYNNVSFSAALKDLNARQQEETVLAEINQRTYETETTADSK